MPVAGLPPYPTNVPGPSPSKNCKLAPSIDRTAQPAPQAPQKTDKKPTKDRKPAPKPRSF